MSKQTKQPVKLYLNSSTPTEPRSLKGVQLVTKVFADGTEKTFKVQRHHLGLCNGCHGYSNKLCDSVVCYEKETPAASYRLVDLTFNKPARERILGE